MPETTADRHTKRQMGEDTSENERNHTWSETTRMEIPTTARRRDIHESLRQSQGQRKEKENRRRKTLERERQQEDEGRTEGGNSTQEPTYEIIATVPETEGEATLIHLQSEKKPETNRLQAPRPRAKQTSKRKRKQEGNQKQEPETKRRHTEPEQRATSNNWTSTTEEGKRKPGTKQTQRTKSNNTNNRRPI